MSSYSTLGPYTAGEIPEQWVHAWNDVDNVDYPLVDYQVDVYYRVNRGAQVVLDTEASLFDAATGRTVVTWSAADFAAPGIMEGEIVVAGDGLRLARSFQCVIRPPRGSGTVYGPAPTADLVAEGVAAHVAAVDPHPGYLTTIEGTALVAVHAAEADPHPGYVTTAEDAAAIAAHAAAADPHTGYTTATELSAALAEVVGFSVDSFAGANDDAKLAAALAAWHATPNGGTILFSARTYTLNNQVVIPTDAGVLHGGTLPTQKPLIMTGVAASTNAWWDPPLDGTILDLKSATGPAKIDVRGTGYFELRYCALVDSAGTTNPFVQITNTTPNIHHNYFSGSKAQRLCDQDAIVCGGSGVTRTGAATDAFAGYGGQIIANTFARIRRCVYGRAGFNGIPIRDNMIGANCGAPDKTAAAIHLASPSSSYYVTGDEIVDNTIECTGYPIAIISGPNSSGHFICGNGFWDAGVANSVCVAFVGSGQNFLRASTYNPADMILYTEDAASARQNDVETTQVGVGQISVKANRQRFHLAAEAPSDALGGGFAVYNPNGNRAYLTVANQGLNPPVLQLMGTAPSAVADGFTWLGSPNVVSLAAVFAATDIGFSIAGGGIPTDYILQTFTAATVPAWTASTVYALGDITRPTTANTHLYAATTAGTSAAVAPTFPTGGGTVTDGTVVWADMGLATAAVMTQPATATQSALLVYWGRTTTITSMMRFTGTHMVSVGAAPSTTVSAGLGGGTATTSGTDTAGTITMTSVGGVAGPVQMCVLNFQASFGAAKVQVAPKNAAAAALVSAGFYTVDAAQTCTFWSVGTVPAGTVFVFDWLAVS